MNAVTRVRTRYYRDLIAWQKAMLLVQAVYRLTNTFPPDERFGLTSQMRRSAVSIPSNIAEGHGRLSDWSLRMFLEIARGSLFELEPQTLLAADMSFASREDANAVLAQIRRSRTHLKRLTQNFGGRARQRLANSLTR